MPPLSRDPGPSGDLPNAFCKGKCTCTYLVSSFVSYHQLSPPTYAFIASLDSRPIHEALSHPGWRNAMI